MIMPYVFLLVTVEMTIILLSLLEHKFGTSSLHVWKAVLFTLNLLLFFLIYYDSYLYKFYPMIAEPVSYPRINLLNTIFIWFCLSANMPVLWPYENQTLPLKNWFCEMTAIYWWLLKFWNYLYNFYSTLNMFEILLVELVHASHGDI